MTLDLSQLYTDTSAHLTAYFAHRLPPAHQHLSEDLTMTTFEKAIRAADRFEHRGVAPKSWLFTIAQNVLIDYRRAVRARGVALSLDGLVDEPGMPDRGYRAVEDRGVIDAALDWLTPEQRPVIEARFLMGLSEKETAARCGATLGGIKKRQARGLATMRRAMEAA